MVRCALQYIGACVKMAGWRKLLLGLGLLVSVLGATGVSAQNFGLYELRGGLLAHSADEPAPNGFVYNFSRLEDVSIDALFYSPDIDAFKWIGSPKINLGGNLNIAGRESHAHLGLTWQIPIFDSPFFIEGTFGGAVHNGALTTATPPARALGSQFLFYEEIGIGAVLPDNWTVLATAEHASNANLASPNRGLTNMGLKFGKRF